MIRSSINARGVAFLATLAAGLVGGPSGAAAQDATPEVRAYRFWRAPDQTLVEGVASVPWSLLTFEKQGELERAIYAATFEVRDEAGNVVLRNEWQDTVVTPPLTPESKARASSTKTFAFRVPKGQWSLSLAVRDAASGRQASAEGTVEGLAAAPSTSDLILAGAIEEVAADGVAPTGSVVRGKLAVLPNIAGAVTTERTRVGIMAEVYRPQTAAAETAQVVVRIEGIGGSNFKYQTPAQTRVFQGGGVDALALDLAGLPPGEYTLTALWAIGEDTLRARHPLRMLPPGSGQIAYAEELPYEGLTEAQLDSVFAPLKYILQPQDELGYEMLTDADAKRRWFAQFWQQLGRSTGQSARAAREEWEERVAYANRFFEKPGGGRSKTFGWQTDRGRIYLINGPPADRLEERQQRRSVTGGGDAKNPWEAWKYISGRGAKYVFWDQTGFGDYILVYSTDPNEPGTPNWITLLTPDAVSQIERW